MIIKYNANLRNTFHLFTVSPYIYQYINPQSYLRTQRNNTNKNRIGSIMDCILLIKANICFKIVFLRVKYQFIQTIRGHISKYLFLE